MLYLLGQILLCLIAAAILGGIIGWLLRGVRDGDTVRDTRTVAVPAPTPGVRTSADEAHLRAAIHECERKLARAEERLAAAGIVLDAPPDPNTPDDLKLISGIGPVIEKQLYELGVTKYRQIAAFAPADIDRVGEEINFFPDRIRRENWIQQARDLHFAKYEERI